MDTCYVDESGSAELLCKSSPDATPIIVVAGLFVPSGEQRNVVWDFLQLKKHFNPSLASASVKLSELVSTEVKGSDIRSDLRSGSRRRTRRAYGFLDEVFDLVERRHCKLAAHIYVKDENQVINDSLVYPKSVRYLVRTFDAFNSANGHKGLVVLDSRTKSKNTPNIHGITTQMFRSGGSPYPNLVEAPVFGHSDTHVSLQVIDLLTSAVLFPSACSAYATPYSWNSHCHPDYAQIKARYGRRVQDLQFRYQESLGGWRGGLMIESASTKFDVTIMFA